MARRKSKKAFEFESPNRGHYGGLWPHQWAWEFCRRNEDFTAIQPRCLEVLYKIAGTHIHKSPKPEILPYWEEFSQTEEYGLLKPFGLIYPEDPQKSGHEISIEIWAPEHVLNSIVMTDNNFDPKDFDLRGRAFILADFSRPRIKQLEEFDFFLRTNNCAEHTNYYDPDNLLELLETYDIYKKLESELGKKPTLLELGKILWPKEAYEIEQHDKRHSVDLEKKLEDKPRHNLREAKKYIEGKKYFEILNWLPDTKSKKKKKRQPTGKE